MIPVDSLNWTTIIVALIGSIPAGIISVIALFQALKTHGLINSRMSELLKTSTDKATAEATLKEIEAEKIRKGVIAEAISTPDQGKSNG